MSDIMGIFSYFEKRRKRKKIKWVITYVGLSILFIICIIVPVCFILSLNDNANEEEDFAKKQCGMFSYDLVLDSDYCVCSNDDVYDVNTKEFLFNRSNALTGLVTSYNESNLNKFNDDYKGGKKILGIITSNDCDVCLKQLSVLKNVLSKNKVNVHYINVDKLLENEKYKITNIINDKVKKSDIYFVVIDDMQVIYKTCKYLDENEIISLLHEYELIID